MEQSQNIITLTVAVNSSKQELQKLTEWSAFFARITNSLLNLSTSDLGDITFALGQVKECTKQIQNDEGVLLIMPVFNSKELVCKLEQKLIEMLEDYENMHLLLIECADRQV